ncbi:WD repeat-containing protein 27-like isoform X2 [Montipora foliosa]|uniref:WD repeat-containing protein 27-like isoform X2 n=1 Tax=Montipora foliosa TaxID=591990 RepID=UPI0035F19740
MAASHAGLLLVSSSPGQLQMSCTIDFLALPLTKTIVGVWWLGDLSKKPLQLSGHSRVVSSTCFGRKDKPLLLCTASDDVINIWNITKLLSLAKTGDHSSGIAIGKDLGNVLHISFSSTDRLITACIGKDVWVINIQTSKLHTMLEGHTSLVTCAQFCPSKESIIVSISEDRTFKVWDIEQSCLVYQSAILSAHPFLSLAFDPVQEQMAIGSADGKVHMYDLSFGNGYRCLFDLDVQQLLLKYWEQKEVSSCTKREGPSLISSLPSWQKGNISEESSASREPGTAVLGIFFIKNPEYLTARQNDVGIHEVLFGPQNAVSMKDVFHVPSIVVIATTGCVLLLNCYSREPLYILDFQEPVLSSDELDEVQYSISSPGSFAFAEGYNGTLTCIIGSLFQNTVNIVNIRMPIMKRPSESDFGVLSQRLLQSVGISSHENKDDEFLGMRGTDVAVITVLSNSPLCSNSPLKAELVPKSATKQHQKQSLKTGGTPGIRDQPLTFHAKVKSSGYASAHPRSKMFSPNIGSMKKAPEVSLRKPIVRKSRKEYPVNSEAPTNLQHKMPLTQDPSPINSVVFAGNGKNLACALANKTAHVLGVPPSTKQTVYTGHDGSVTCVSFSRENSWLLTSSSDKTVRLWNQTQSDPVMIFSSVNHNFVSELGTSANKLKDNPPFPREIKQAKFYYVDKFILLTCGNGLHMYKYHIDVAQKEDVRRYQSNSKYKIVKILQQERAQQITCFSAINGFHSYIVLCCGSNKSIEVFDMNAARSVRVVLDAHTRPPHAICQNEGSMFVSHPPSTYDLFLTAAVADGIKLWDLRTNRLISTTFEEIHIVIV